MNKKMKNKLEVNITLKIFIKIKKVNNQVLKL